MKPILLLAGAVFAVVALAATQPDAPVLSESFTLEGLLSVEGQEGRFTWSVDQVHGQTVEKFVPVNGSGVWQVGHYDQSTLFVMADDCVAKPLGPSMPISWAWLKYAKFVGVQTIEQVDMNCWTSETSESYRQLCVPVNNDMSGAVFSFRNASAPSSLPLSSSAVAVLRLLTFVEGAQPDAIPSALYAVPATCPPALPVQHEITNWEAPANASGLLKDLYGVLNKAKEICTCGCPYVWGGNGPCCYGQPSGYDCSGMTYRAYSVGGYKIPRVAADQQKSGRACSGGELPGDLFFFGNPAYHVVMNLGSGSIAECPRTGLNCRITSRRAYDGGCRRIA